MAADSSSAVPSLEQQLQEQAPVAAQEPNGLSLSVASAQSHTETPTTRKRTCKVSAEAYVSFLMPSDTTCYVAKGPSVRRACAACHTGKTRCSETLPCQVSVHKVLRISQSELTQHILLRAA
jgi:hypothetical protein